MSLQSIVLFSNAKKEVVFISDPVRVDYWYKKPQGKKSSLSIVASNFRGRLTIQASIKLNPTEKDWFPVLLDCRPYLDYPRNGVAQAFDGGYSGGPTSIYGGGYGGETSTTGFNFFGRFVWMRAIIDRRMLIPEDATQIMIGACGIIDRVLVNI